MNMEIECIKNKHFKTKHEPQSKIWMKENPPPQRTFSCLESWERRDYREEHWAHLGASDVMVSFLASFPPLALSYRAVGFTWPLSHLASVFPVFHLYYSPRLLLNPLYHMLRFTLRNGLWAAGHSIQLYQLNQSMSGTKIRWWPCLFPLWKTDDIMSLCVCRLPRGCVCTIAGLCCTIQTAVASNTYMQITFSHATIVLHSQWNMTPCLSSSWLSLGVGICMNPCFLDFLWYFSIRAKIFKLYTGLAS